jgi:hypothetical protein
MGNFLSSGHKLSPELDQEIKNIKNKSLNNRNKRVNDTISEHTSTSSNSNSNSNTTSTSTSTSTLSKLKSKFWEWKFTIISILVLIAIATVCIIILYLPNKDKQDKEKDEENKKKKIREEIAAKQREENKKFSKLPLSEIIKINEKDRNSNLTRVVLYNKDRKIIDDTYNKINYKITELTTELVNNLEVRIIQIKNCKITLKTLDGKEIKYIQYMEDKPNGWLEQTLQFDYQYVTINIMSEIILFDSDGKVIINDKINQKDINETIRIPNISYSSFKIRNCNITLYSSPNYLGDQKTYEHDSTLDDIYDHSDDSKSFLKMSLLDTNGKPLVYKSIQIVPIK